MSGIGKSTGAGADVDDLSGETFNGDVGTERRACFAGDGWTSGLLRCASKSAVRDGRFDAVSFGVVSSLTGDAMTVRMES
jgi:hypothetical protein